MISEPKTTHSRREAPRHATTDHPKVLRGGVFGAAVHLVDACVGFVVLVGFVGDNWVDGEVENCR